MLADLTDYPPGPPNGTRHLCPVDDCGWYLDELPVDEPLVRTDGDHYRLTMPGRRYVTALDAAAWDHLTGDHDSAELPERVRAALADHERRNRARRQGVVGLSLGVSAR